jgi:heptose-I-phosphate ethanolaminephosphotransferase
LRRRPGWFSAASLGIIGLFFLDAAIKGFLRDYFGLRPNPVLVLQAIFNTNPAESSGSSATTGATWPRQRPAAG